MPRVDRVAGELHIKITYHGTGLAGRVTNLQYIYNKTRPELKNRMVSVATETERSLSFDFRPLSLGDIDGLRPRIHLWCSSSCRVIEGAKEKVLEGADGVVFVADSHPFRLEANIEAWENLEIWIDRQGRRLADLPLTLQYNKRDYPEVVSVADLDAALNIYRRPTFEAVATMGQGVFDTLKDIVRQVLTRARAST